MKKLKSLQVRFNDSEEDEKLVELISSAKNKTKKLKDMARYGVEIKEKHEKLKKLALEVNGKNSLLEAENKLLNKQILELTETIRNQANQVQELSEEKSKLAGSIVMQKASINELANRGLWARIINKKPIYMLNQDNPIEH